MSDARISLLPPFIPTLRSARALSGLFVLCAAVAWIAVGYDLAELRRLSTAADSAAAAHASRLAHARTGEILRTAQLACLGVTGVCFVAWLHRVRVNARALGARRLGYRRAWTVLGFLVPFLNIVRPYRVVREVWRASDPRGSDPVAWQRLRAPRRLALWWGSFVAYGLLELVSLGVLSHPLAPAHVQMGHALGLLADANAALSASLACFVVVQLSELQQEKHEARGGAPPLGFGSAMACGSGTLTAG